METNDAVRGAGVATFWAGRALPALYQACLSSFTQAGHDVTVYSFEPISGVPEGIRVADARGIVSEDLLYAFNVKGKPSVGHFSDVFRYHLFSRTESIWIDADLVCLPGRRLPPTLPLFGRETEFGLNGAVMRISSGDPRLARLIERAAGMADKPIAWGATGPRLVSEVFGTTAVTAAPPPEVFYPVHWDDWFMPFLPSMREQCRARCGKAITLHLWNNIVERAGYWTELAPPEGSYLHEVFRDLDVLSGFRDTVPESVMVALHENWRHAITGDRFETIEIARIVASRVFNDRHKGIVRKLRRLQAKYRLSRAAGV